MFIVHSLNCHSLLYSCLFLVHRLMTVTHIHICPLLPVRTESILSVPWGSVNFNIFLTHSSYITVLDVLFVPFISFASHCHFSYSIVSQDFVSFSIAPSFFLPLSYSSYITISLSCHQCLKTSVLSLLFLINYFFCSLSVGLSGGATVNILYITDTHL